MSRRITTQPDANEVSAENPKHDKFVDATIMALDHVTDGDFTSVCEDSDFGNDLLEWLHAQRKRITTRQQV